MLTTVATYLSSCPIGPYVTRTAPWMLPYRDGPKFDPDTKNVSRPAVYNARLPEALAALTGIGAMKVDTSGTFAEALRPSAT